MRLDRLSTSLDDHLLVALHIPVLELITLTLVVEEGSDNPEPNLLPRR